MEILLNSMIQIDVNTFALSGIDYKNAIRFEMYHLIGLRKEFLKEGFDLPPYLLKKYLQSML